tara:strand:+ start:234 stop:656 length:423 start_codon:yes stop_codon:yes gene_type:complete
MTIRPIYFLLPLVVLSACKSTSDTNDTSTESDTSEDSGTDTYTETEPEVICGELEEATTSMAIAGTIETDSTSYLVCTESTENESCPDYSDLPSSFIEDTIGNPWGDPYCWYSVLAACGPETSIPDQCCYEFIFNAIACA